MKIGYGGISGDIYLILGPGYSDRPDRAKTLRLKDMVHYPNTCLVNIREFTISDLLIIPIYFSSENKALILQAIKELVQCNHR